MGPFNGVNITRFYRHCKGKFGHEREKVKLYEGGEALCMYS